MPEQPSIQQRDAQPYAAIARQVTLATFADAVDSGFPALFAWLEERGIVAAGPPFIRYLVIDGDREFDIELAVPVAAPVPGDAQVMARELPAGRWVVLRHIGPYGGLVDAHVALERWAEEQGIAWDRWSTERGVAWRGNVEHYVTDARAEPDSSTWVTEVACLAAD